MSDERQEALTRFAANYQRDGKGLVTVATCRNCGQWDWVCTDTNPERGVIETDMVPGRCGQCHFVFQRFPELAVWVLSVVHEQRRRAGLREGDGHG